MHRSTGPVAAVLSAFLGLHASYGQVARPDLSTTPIRVSSGVVSNSLATSAVLFRHVVAVASASSMQLQFGRTKLSRGCVLRMTSLTDGGAQHHRAETLGQWRNASAWFNGPAVLVELIAEPGSPAAHVTIDAAITMGTTTDDRSICFGVDDRELSFDDRSGRLAPIGCSAWLIDDAAHSFLCAGHCLDNSSVVEIMEFNVPLSNGDGSWNHPGPEDQYPVDLTSIQFTDGGIGNDWAYYGCFENTETELTAYEAQGNSHVLADAAPAMDGRDITITGYGSVSSPVSPTWYGVQKTHTGPYMLLDGTTIGYQTDTTSGNSGSPVLDEVTGLAIGIHTHAGCDSSGGWNHGTNIIHADLQYAMDHPLGVCIPSLLAFHFPAGRPEAVLPGNPTDLLFGVMAGDEAPDPESVMLVVTIDGTPSMLPADPLGDDLFAATIPAVQCGQDVSFYLSANTESGTAVTHPINAPDTQFTLLVGTLESTMLLDESFADGIPGDWSASGLWHASSGGCAPAGMCQEGAVAYFGQEGNCDYDTGGTESGQLTSPAIPLAGVGGDMSLSFCTALTTENASGWDEARVLVNGVSIALLENTSGWTEYEIDLTNVSGDTLAIGFDFDTGDEQFNDYAGWHLDNVQISASTVDCTDVPACPADIDGNGEVDTDDLLALIADWGAANSPADIDGDGTVGTDDLLALISAWGPCI
jgi:V8-like Glu-specific endopeptidase